MGDWTTKEDCFAELVSNYDNAELWKDILWTDLAWIQDAIDASNALLACQRIQYALGRCYNIVRFLIDHEAAYTPAYPILYYFEHYAGVTYQSICEAWFANDFEGRAVTIACIDRMRQILWNEPYSAQWAARPEEQEIE